MTTATTRHDLYNQFQRLIQQWKSESRDSANTDELAVFRCYQRIITLGEPAIPLILEELRREPEHWFWALEAITLENPVPEEAMGNNEAMAQAWLQWGFRRGYIARV
jgi:hypothetical protein